VLIDRMSASQPQGNNSDPGFLALPPAHSRSKRRFDILVAPLLLFLVLPVMLLIAVLIKATSTGPILFRQPRIGQHNRIFECYKFRTMYAESADLLCDRQTVVGDTRITGFGRWLRRLSLDELPQLFNVIRGDMSLVGPRPHAPATKAGGVFFADVVSHYGQRHGVLPGITGWAQINGYRGETRTRQQLIQRLEFDLHYIRHWSVWFDIVIICRTVVFVLFDENAG
jgi:lipopolysaccharide/colanic/teichoic acid biosynthesis glycosyltransferase